jgi:DNA-binding transcriptional LysR family regulator
MHALDLNLLPVLRAVLEEGSVTRAAERLRMSPSATSRAIDRCRRLVGDPLLVPHGRGLVATPAAEQLLPRLARALDDLTHVLDAGGFSPSTLRRTFVVRASDAVIAMLGGRLTTVVATHAPGARLRFEHETERDVADIRAGEVALGIGAYGDMTTDVAGEVLGREPLVGVIRADHPLAGGATVSLPEFAGLRHIVASRRGRVRGPLDDLLQAHGLRRRVVAVVPSVLTALAMVRTEDATTIVPQRVATLGEGLRAFPLPFPVEDLEIQQIWHGRYTADPAHAWLRSCVRQAVDRLDADARIDPVGAD